MTDRKLQRRTFLKMGGAGLAAALVGWPFSASPAARRNREFRLSKPEWVIYRDGSFDLISEEIRLKNCRPSIDGEAIMPINVFLGDSPKGKRIVYELRDGFLMLDLKANRDSVSIGSELSGFTHAPHWFFPISQARVEGASRFFKQGLGSGGPSGVYEISRSVKREWGNRAGEESWSYDSYLTFALLGESSVIAVGAYEHNDYLHRSTLYNRPHRQGLADRYPGGEAVYFESGFSMERVPFENEYTKLPDIQFIGGNDAFNTLQYLAWNISDSMQARLGGFSCYHWRLHPGVNENFSLAVLQQSLSFLKGITPALPVQTVQIDDKYCLYGDWLEPDERWPGGLDKAAREIFQLGYRAGISLAPFRVDEKSKLFRRHPEWVIRDKNDNPVPEIRSVEGNHYALDGSHPEVQKYLSRVFRAFRKMGFIYYKTDFMDWGLKDSTAIRRAVPGKSSVQVYREICQIIRSEIGAGSFWLATGAPFGPTIGFADAVRVTNDLACSWSESSVENMVQETYLGQYYNNVLWQNDPDVLSLDSKKCELSADAQQSIALWNGILGGMVTTADPIGSWDPQQLKFFRFLEPDRRPRSASLPFWPDANELKIAVKNYRSPRGWGILFFNDKGVAVNRSYAVSSLIEPERAFIFSWQSGQSIAYGELGQLTIQLEPHQSKLFFLSEEDTPPPTNLTLGGQDAEGLKF